jgi:hypothetical protein
VTSLFLNGNMLEFIFLFALLSEDIWTNDSFLCGTGFLLVSLAWFTDVWLISQNSFSRVEILSWKYGTNDTGRIEVLQIDDLWSDLLGSFLFKLQIELLNTLVQWWATPKMLIYDTLIDFEWHMTRKSL